MTEKIPIKGNLTIRKRADGYLLMNKDTSGFHAVSFDGYEILNLCNGKNTVKGIISKLAKKYKIEGKEMKKFERDVDSFLKELEKRRLVK